MARLARDPDTDENRRFLARAASAEQRLSRVRGLIDECYEFALPLSERSYSTGDRASDRVFDTTAGDAVQEFASQMVEDVWPTDSRPFDLLPGGAIDPGKREEAAKLLASVADDIIETVNGSNFQQCAAQVFQDYALGQGFMLPEAGDATDPLVHRAIPLTQAVPDIGGPRSDIDALFVPMKLKAHQMPTRFKDLPPELVKAAAETPERELDLTEGYERDWSEKGTETWKYRCVWKDKGGVALDKGVAQGDGSRPFLAPSFMRVTGETIGRGPVRLALPDIRCINILKELIIAHADLQLEGIWTVEDDGVVNIGSINLAPGTIVPKARDSAGLQRVEMAKDLGLAEWLYNSLRGSIRQTLFAVEYRAQGGKTPASATEVIGMQVARARKLSGPFGGLLRDFLFPYVRRVAYLRREQGYLAKEIKIDGKTIVFRPLSPITRAQAQDDVLRHDRYIELLTKAVGPQQAQILVDSEKYGEWLAQKMGVDPNIVRGQAKRKQLVEAIAQAAAMAQQAQAQAPAA